MTSDSPRKELNDQWCLRERDIYMAAIQSAACHFKDRLKGHENELDRWVERHRGRPSHLQAGPLFFLMLAEPLLTNVEFIWFLWTRALTRSHQTGQVVGKWVQQIFFFFFFCLRFSSESVLVSVPGFHKRNLTQWQRKWVCVKAWQRQMKER